MDLTWVLRTVERHVTIRTLGLAVFLLSAPSLWSQSGASALQEQGLEAGRNGEFSSARQVLDDAERQLRAESPGSSDFSGNVQRVSTLGFVQLLRKIAADCANRVAPASVGRQLYDAGGAARSGDLNRALSEASGAVAGSGNYAPAHALLGRVRLGKCMGSGQDCEAAIGSLREALRLDSGLLVAELDLGMALVHTGDAEGGVRAYQRVLELDHDKDFTGVAHAQLAMLYAKQSNWPLADQHAKGAASLGLTLPLGLAQDIAKKAASPSGSSGEPPGAKSGTSADGGQTDSPKRPDSIDDFVSGLFGPIKVVVTGLSQLLKGSDSASLGVDEMWDQTWGKGSTSYRFGFVVAAILCLGLLEQIGSAGNRRRRRGSSLASSVSESAASRRASGLGPEAEPGERSKLPGGGQHSFGPKGVCLRCGRSEKAASAFGWTCTAEPAAAGEEVDGSRRDG